MTKTKKTRIIGIFLIVILIVLGSTGAYLVKVNKEKSLNIQIEEVNKSFSSLKIPNMNSDEVEFYNKLKDSFNKSIGNKNLSEANNVLNKINDLKSSVEKRVKEEEKNAEEEKIKKENERELALKDEYDKKEDEVKENTINKVDTSNIQQSIPTNNEPKISNTSVAQNSRQIISVVSTGGSTAELVLWQKDSNGKWYEYDSMFARLGENGMKAAKDVYEMDLCTPTGVYSLTEAFGAAQNPGSGVPYRVLDGSEYWIDDVNSPYYNTMQFGEPNGRWNSAEYLIDHSNSYKYALIIDYNRYPVIIGKSSAIFLHVDVGVPTWGCVAVEQSKMKEILQWINPEDNPKIMLALSYNELYSY